MSSAVSRAVRTVTRWAEWFNALLPLRVWNRLSLVRGAILVKGIAYSAFFSIFPIVALAFTGFGLVLRSRPEWQTRLIADMTLYLEQNLPGATSVIDPARIVEEFTSGGLLTQAAIIAVITLIWAALGWVSALRLGIRAAMHLPVADFHPVVAKIRDFGVALLLGGAIVVSAVVSVGINTATDDVLNLLGVPGGAVSATPARIVSFVAVVALDTVLFYLQFKVLAASPLPRRFLWWGAAFAALAFGVLKLAAGVLIGTIGDNGATSVIVGVGGGVLALLIWMNLVARITLLAAAWVGLAAEESAEAAEPDAETHALMLREAVAAASNGGASHVGASAVRENGGPTGRAEDRVVLAAGVVLGATAAVGVRALGSALAAVAGAVAGALPNRDEDD